jgi:hypothetical protein
MKRALWLAVFLALFTVLVAEPLTPKEFGQRIFELVNQIRVKNGIAPLLWNTDLASLADMHSLNMAYKGFFDHIDHEGLQVSQRQQKYFPRLIHAGIGENLFFIDNSKRVYDPQEIVSGWMDSPGHRENILQADFTHTGVGVFLLEDKLYTTQVFGIPILELMSDLPAEFMEGESVAAEFEYIAAAPRDSFQCMLGTPDPHTKVKTSVMTYYEGCMPLQLVWKSRTRLILPLEFNYGKGDYDLQAGWNGYYYSGLMTFRVK